MESITKGTRGAKSIFSPLSMIACSTSGASFTDRRAPSRSTNTSRAPWIRMALPTSSSERTSCPATPMIRSPGSMPCACMVSLGDTP
jgi:hypothetical protein